MCTVDKKYLFYFAFPSVPRDKILKGTSLYAVTVRICKTFIATIVSRRPRYEIEYNIILYYA